MLIDQWPRFSMVSIFSEKMISSRGDPHGNSSLPMVRFCGFGPLGMKALVSVEKYVRLVWLQEGLFFTQSEPELQKLGHLT